MHAWLRNTIWRFLVFLRLQWPRHPARHPASPPRLATLATPPRHPANLMATAAQVEGENGLVWKVPADAPTLRLLCAAMLRLLGAVTNATNYTSNVTNMTGAT